MYKINNLFLCLSVCVLICCKTKNESSGKTEKISLKTEDNSVSLIIEKDSSGNNTSLLEEDITLETNKTELEYFTETLYINNKYPFEGKIEKLKYLVKKADSINKQEDDCGYFLEDSHEIWDYLNCEIEISKTEYVFRKIDFILSKFTVKYGSIIFSSNYTIKEFKNDFPVSFLKNRYDDDSGIITVNLLIHPLSDDMYILKFNRDRLIQILYFTPC